MPGNKNEYRSTLASPFRPGRSRSASGSSSDVVDADLATKGILYAQARTGNVYPRVAWGPPTGSALAITKYAGTVAVTSGLGLTPTFAVVGTPSHSDGASQHGTARRSLRADTALIANTMTFSTSFIRRDGGFYAVAKLLIPSTAGQANLNDRGVRIGVYSTAPSDITTDPAGHFIEWKYTQSQQSNWALRCKDGTSVSSVNDAAPALDQIYVFEIWTPGGSGNVFGRLNHGTVRTLSTNLPGATTNMGNFRICHKQDVDNGDSVLDFYYFGIGAF